jgi:tRNA 2-thiouridine synthesizing protein A
MSQTDEIRVDARGHRCPAPTLRLARALRAAPEGAVVVLIADDPLARIDAPHFAAGAGHEVIGIDAEKDGVLLIRIRKGGGATKGRGAPPRGG